MIPGVESDKSELLLEKFRYKEMEGVYILGCTAAVLYIHAQQQRAFNLVWALTAQEKISEGCEVAVIGGGISGLTAAVALAGSKAKVTVFERTQKALSFQRGNLTRFVHPNVARWPEETSGYPITHLPFMNWRAGIVGTVNSEIESQWKIAKKFFEKTNQLTLLEDKEVTAVLWNPDKKCVELTVSKEKKDIAVVILAVGYGIEISDHGIGSYWHNDNFAQPVLGPEPKKKYLVSGIGDGALTEILRLKLTDFQHHKFIDSVIFEPKLKAAGLKAQENDWSGWTKKGAELKAEFAEFFFEDPKDQKDSKIRLDTEVVLVGDESEPHVHRAKRLFIQGSEAKTAWLLTYFCSRLRARIFKWCVH